MIELVKLLSEQHKNIWLAGDDDQSIYSFRGARSDIFVSLDKEYGTNTKTITMPHNYRSTGNILKAANSLISHNKVRVKKSMVTDNGDGEEIQILEAQNEIDEAELIAQIIVELKEGVYRYDEIAILVRVHRLMPLIEAALIREKIPYTSLAGFLYRRQEIKTAINIMKYFLSGEPAKGLDRALIEEIRTDLFPHYERISFEESFYIAGSYLMIKPENDEEDEEEKSFKRLYLDAFEYLISPHKNVNDLLEHIKEAKIVNNRSSTGRLHLMTIHQAKGLQFKCVFVPGLNEGILPHINSVEQLVNLEEERRLMYVAITRAMERLFVTYRRTQSGQPITIRSRFITELSA
jgi:DNA helicase-2/ATP-dependent DNA helicase PcrA